MRWAHRWLSLVLGLLLVLITTSGAILLYEPQLEQVLHPAHYRATPSAAPLSLGGAATIAERRVGGTATYVEVVHGIDRVYATTASGASRVVNVDPGSRRVLDVAGGPTGVVGLLDNFHQCFLTCEGYPGYVAAFNHPMPDLGVQGVEKLSVAGFVLGVTGLLAVVLALTGLVLWWPRAARSAWRRAVSVRWSKGRYKRHYDLHKVVGIAVVPFLLMWGVTGADFEMPVVAKAWFAVLPGDEPTSPALTSTSPAGRDVGYDAALRAARRRVGGPGRLTVYQPPTDDDATATYGFGFKTSSIPRVQSDRSPSNVFVEVDRRDAGRVAIDGQGQSGRRVAAVVHSDWFFATHFGSLVNPWWRLVWFVFGLAPLLLMVTGVVTWTIRTRKRRRKTRASGGGRRLRIVVPRRP